MSQFHFKRFSISHDQSSMKVGTDAVLLGSWSRVEVGGKILEVGSGCGVVSCMLAQRGALVTGIDIHESSVLESRENAAVLPFDNTPEFCCADFFCFTSKEKFASIVSNPPFFVHSLKSENEIRSQARHLNVPWIEDFWRKCAELTEVVQLVIPFIDSSNWLELANKYEFKPVHCCEVYSFETDKNPVRLLIEFHHLESQQVKTTKLVLYNADKTRTKEYSEFCKDFYL